MKKLLLMLLSALVLTSCGSEAVPEQETEAPAVQTEETAAQETGIRLTDGKASLFKIVRPEDADEEEVDAAIEFRKALEEKTGVKFAFGTDWEEKGSVPEILIGSTKREESAEVKKSLTSIQYCVDADENRILLYGDTVQTLNAAAEYFLENCLTTDATGNTVIEPVSVTKTIQLAPDELPMYPYGRTAVYESSSGTKILHAQRAKEEEFKAYINLLESAGYEKYTGAEFGGNTFVTYTNEALQVNIGYFPGPRSVRVAWEPKKNLPGLETDNVYENAGSVETMLTIVDLEEEVLEGASLIYRMDDGSFIIIDGGYADKRSVEAKKLLEILKEQTTHEKPVIAAWIFSHPHGDHIGTFNDFARLYHDEVVIEQIICNFPSEEELLVSDKQVVVPSHYQVIGLGYNEINSGFYFKEAMEKYYSDVPVVKPHTGNIFYIRNAKIEVLYTHEDLYPSSVMSHGTNSCSVIYKVHIGGQSTLLLGDATEVAGDTLLAQFGDYVKSDIMQLAHHGFGGGTVRLYERVDPTFCIHTTAWASYFSTYDYDHNKWCLEESENIKLMVVSGFGTSTIKLPLNFDDVEVSRSGEYNRIPGRRWKNPEFWN